MRNFFGYVLLALLATGLGWGTGYLVCQRQYVGVEEKFYDGEFDAAEIAKRSPVLVIEGGFDHDFGPVEEGNSYNHEFIVENRGDGNLKLSLINKTDNIEIELSENGEIISPGASLPMAVTLIVKEGGSKSGTVELSTNDAQKTIRLTVYGSS